MAHPPPSTRLLIVANRLPMSLKKDSETGEYSFRMSSGGLVSALLGVKNIKMKWIGWPGCEIKGETVQADVTQKLAEKNCVPVYLNKGEFRNQAEYPCDDDLMISLQRPLTFITAGIRTVSYGLCCTTLPYQLLSYRALINSLKPMSEPISSLQMLYWRNIALVILCGYMITT